MPLSEPMRKLLRRWQADNGWPKRLQWLEIHGLRGWTGQRIEFSFPLMAVVGENGSGKSTILQAAACAYQSGRKTTKYPAEFFPKTAWDAMAKAEIKFGFREGGQPNQEKNLRKGKRWLGKEDRPIREVQYVDLRRIQPVSARVGYAKIAKTRHSEASFVPFDDKQVQRLSDVMGRKYEGAKMALSDVDKRRRIPVVTKEGTEFSGFHQGSGETTIAELLQKETQKTALVLIDEIESSLHPRAQRRLMNYLAEICREHELQIILSTHSPYILEQLPPEARLQILEVQGTKRVVRGVSPEFAMSNMDDRPHPECEVFVEDNAAKAMVEEVLARHSQQTFMRSSVISYGAINVGQALGLMISQRRFATAKCVFLDGDASDAPGCTVLPGGDAPERVVFESLKAKNWREVGLRIGRDPSVVADSCSRAMTLGDHHDWISHAASSLRCSGDSLWRQMCIEWALYLAPEDAEIVTNAVEAALNP